MFVDDCNSMHIMDKNSISYGLISRNKYKTGENPRNFKIIFNFSLIF